MSFAAPLFAWVSGAVALATVALHLLAWRRPPESPLPTARFAPERPVRMVSRAVRLADTALLALRVLTILLVGVALARPTFVTRRQGTARVIVVDRSRIAATSAAVADAARATFRAGDALIVFDSTAREVSSPTADSISTVSSSAMGSLSAALVRAVPAARRLARARDAVEIVIISPLATDELDAATRSIRGTWPGRLRLLRVRVAPNDENPPGRPSVRASAGDPVAASLALGGEAMGGDRVQVVRDGITARDSALVRDGGVLVLWPADAAPAGWQRHRSADTSFAVTAIGAGAASSTAAARSATVVAPFVRELLPPPGHVSARWSDGEPAVTETALGSGCIRSVAVPVPVRGDLSLTPAFRHFAERMLEPCLRAMPWTVASDTVLAGALPATTTPSADANSAILAGSEAASGLTAWLLGLALLAAMVEMLVRRGESDATA